MDPGRIVAWVLFTACVAAAAPARKVAVSPQAKTTPPDSARSGGAAQAQEPGRPNGTGAAAGGDVRDATR
jgi:hypothetical protein